MTINSDTKIALDMILEHLTRNCYDVYHGFGPERCWAVDMVPLLDSIAETLGVSKVELGKYFDEIRYRVHGDKARAEDMGDPRGGVV